MLRYLSRKALILLLSLLAVATLTFILMHSAPGDPFSQEQALSPEAHLAMRRYYGLDKPLWMQYFIYLKGILSFDLGISIQAQGRSVNEIISSGFPISLVLGLESLIIAVSGGVALGTLAALHRAKPIDRIVMVIAVLGISVPSFILATFLQYLFAMKLCLLPIARWGTFAHSILPSLSLAALPLAFIARLTRGSMIEILENDYIQTARAKGLSQFQIISKHMLKNGMLPVITYLGPLTTSVITGSFVIEKIFGIPGLGKWFVASICDRDYTVIMGITLFYSLILMIAILIVDLLYCMIDPRINLYFRDKA